MVSIRRHKLLACSSGLKNSLLVPLPKFSEIGCTAGTKPVSVHPSAEVEETKEASGAPKALDFTVRGEQLTPHFPEVKRRKRHRRKHFENQEPCVMRGVYFKNMKWQAAIKVDKKQIHLGTVGSQEEAARLYDRAAFMCGREPNFELPEEEKQELRKFKWDEFLEMTRSAVNHKKPHKKAGSVGSRRKSEALRLKNGWGSRERGDDGRSGSEDAAELDDTFDS